MEYPKTTSALEMINERLPWSTPVVKRLEVALDTRDTGGSSGDGELGTVFDLVQP